MAEFSKKDKQGLALAGGVVIAFLGLFAAYFALSNKEQLDERLCPRAIERKTVILVDLSDGTPAQTIDEIKSRITRLIQNEVHQGELVSVFYVTDAAQTALRPEFSACLPQSEANIVYESEREITKSFEEAFQQPLDEALGNQQVGSDASPLAEVVTDFVASSYLDAPYNRLVIFSDLMQNSSALNLYSCSDGASAIDTYRAARAGAIERPELLNTAVSLNIIPREGLGRQVADCRGGFWNWYFGDNTGQSASTDVTYLPGGASVL